MRILIGAQRAAHRQRLEECVATPVVSTPDSVPRLPPITHAHSNRLTML